MFKLNRIKVPILGIDQPVILLLESENVIKFGLQVYNMIKMFRLEKEYVFTDFISIVDEFTDINTLVCMIQEAYRLCSYKKVEKLIKRYKHTDIDILDWWNNIFSASRFIIPLTMED